MKKIKICLACSAGGHLTEMLQLSSVYNQYPHFFVTFKRPDTQSLAQKETVHFIERPARNPILTIKAFFEAQRILKQEKPTVLISTGADVSIPVILAAKLMGCKIVFIESFCRPIIPGYSGKIAYPLADLFIYQWKELEKYYPKGVFGGSIF